MGSVGQDALQDKMAETEEKTDPPPAYVEPDAATPNSTTDVVPINKERPDSAWNEPAPVRDPQRLNTHLQVEWDDLIGEPDGVKTMDCAWNLSKKCYTGCLGGCYTLATLFTAPFLGCYLGMGMAYMVFVLGQEANKAFPCGMHGSIRGVYSFDFLQNEDSSSRGSKVKEKHGYRKSRCFVPNLGAYHNMTMIQRIIYMNLIFRTNLFGQFQNFIDIE